MAQSNGPTNRATVAPAHYYKEDVAEVKQEIFTGAHNLYGLELENNGASPVYLQFFDALVASVTVGTTTPDFTFVVPANGVWGKDPQNYSMHFFSTGCVIAVTAGRTSAIAPASPATVHIWHSKKG